MIHLYTLPAGVTHRGLHRLHDDDIREGTEATADAIAASFGLRAYGTRVRDDLLADAAEKIGGDERAYQISDGHRYVVTSSTNNTVIPYAHFATRAELDAWARAYDITFLNDPDESPDLYWMQLPADDSNWLRLGTGLFETVNQ